MITGVEFVSIGTINVRAGDIVLIRTATPPDEETAERLRGFFWGAPVVFVGPDVDIAKWSPDEAIERASGKVFA